METGIVFYILASEILWNKCLEYDASKWVFILSMQMTKPKYMLLLNGLFCKDLPKLSPKMQIVVKVP